MVSSTAYKVLIPVTDLEHFLLPLAIATGFCHLGSPEPYRAGSTRILVLNIVEVAEGENVSEAALLARQQRQLLRRALREYTGEQEVLPLVRISRHAWEGIGEVVAAEAPRLLLLPWSGQAKASDRLFGTTIRQIVANPPCDIALIRAQPSAELKRILLPLRGGPHAWLALELVRCLVEHYEAQALLMRVDTEDAPWAQRARERELFADLANAVRDHPRIQSLTVKAPSAEEAILREATRHDLVVMGATVEGDTLFGPLVEKVLSAAPSSVMVVKTRQPVDLSLFEPKPLAISQVDKWFAENTFHSREFSRIEELVGLKRHRGLRISLGLPALNEAATVRRVLTILRDELMIRYPLLDDMVLIDGGSTDATREIAQELGVPVFVQQEVLPQYGPLAGKGEALWKSLYLLSGDIIVWMDTDIKNIHPKFVYGVIGPLLRESRLKYVVGFYRRPLRLGSAVYETAGDRVTELTARPLINLFFPELSGLIEPLSRETAARREVLEQIPFFSGFSTEIGHLLDIYSRFGLAAIAQVDLEERIHRENPVESLTQRAFSLIQVLMRRLEERRKVRLLDEINTTMKLIRSEGDRHRLEVRVVEDLERPPMITIPEYRLQREEHSRQLAAGEPTLRPTRGAAGP